VELVEEVAASHQVKPAQIALAWVLAQGEHLIPIPGTKKLKYLAENAAASQIELTADEITRLSNAVPAEGERYPEVSMAFVNR